jgi:hypothetical protein
MKTSSSSKQLSLALASALALAFASGAVQAQSGPNSDREVWTENTRAQIWKNAFGECWHSMYGPPPGYNECNPAPIAQYVAPAPAPAPYVPPPPQAQYVAPPPAPVIAPAPLPRKKDRN